MPETSERRLSARGALDAIRRNWSAPSLARNVILNWTSTGLMILSALVLTPIIVGALDKELYGIWSFLNGLLVYTDLLYLGLGSALVRYAAEHLAQRDTKSLNRLCSVVFTIYVVLGLISLAVAGAIAPVVPSFFANGLTPASAAAARYTCVVLGFRLLSLFVSSVFVGALFAADRADIARVGTISFTLARLALIPVVVRSGSPLVALAILIAVTAACETIVMAWLAARVVPTVRPRLVLPGARELRVLYGFGLQAFLVTMAVKLICYTDQTVIGVMLGATSVALYVLPQQLVEYGRVAINGIVTVLLPRLTVLHTNRDAAGLGDAYIEVSRVTCMVAAFINVNLIMLGPSFLNRWVGPEFGQPAHVILICLGAASVFQALSTQAALPFFQATWHLLVPAVVLGIEGLANLALTLLLVPYMGLNGVAVGTLVPSFCITFFVLPLYMCRKLHVAPVRLITQVMPHVAVVAAMSFVVLAALKYPLPNDSYADLAARAGLCTATVAAPVAAVLYRSRRTASALFACRVDGGERTNQSPA